jgi:hypothetical protein
MKLFGIDLSLKHITVRINGEVHMIVFRISPIKGIYDVRFDSGDIELINAYPPASVIAMEYRRIYIPNWFKRTIKRLQKQHQPHVH